MIRNVLWFVDGALFDTYPAMTYALSRAMSELGKPVALNLIGGLVRESLDRCIQTLSQRYRVPHESIRSGFDRLYQAVTPDRQPPLPGVKEVCQYIHEQGGKNVAIAQGSLSSVQRLLEAHEMAGSFAGALSLEQGYPGMPDPAILLAALDQHNLDPDETLLVGRCKTDLQAGQAAVLHTCLCRQDEGAQSAGMQVESYGQLLAVLKK